MTSTFRVTGSRVWVVTVCLCAAVCSFAIQAAAARTLEQVKALGALSMCANPDALPYSSNNPDSPGFQIEIGRAIAHGLGMPLDIDWVVPRRRVAEVNCDMLLDNVNDPELRREHRLVSIPYQKAGIALALGQKAEGVNGLRDLKKGQKIGVMVGSLASMVLGKQGLSISPYAFQSDMLEDLQNGELFATAISSATLGYYLKQRPDMGLRMVSLAETDPELAWTVSVGLRHADQALLGEVNKIIASLLADGTIARIYAKYGVEHHVP